MTKTCAFAALTLAALAGTAFANPDGDMPGTLPGRVVHGLQPAEYPPARALPEVIQPTFDNIVDSFVAPRTRVVLGGGGLNIIEDLNFNPGPWGSSYAGPRLATSMLGFGYQFSGTSVPIDCDLIFDFYDRASLDYTRVFTPGAMPGDPPVSPGMLSDNTNSLARLTFQIRALTPGFIYTFENINLTGLPGGGVSFAADGAAVRVRAVRAGTDPLLPASGMFSIGAGQPAGFVNPSSNPAGQPAAAQIVFPMWQINYRTGSTSTSYGRDNNLDFIHNGAAVAAAAGAPEHRFLAGANLNTGFAIGLSGDAPPPPAPTPATDIGTLDCTTSSPANQTADITVATPGDPLAMPPIPATSGSVQWFKLTLPGPVSIADGTFLNIIAADTMGFGIDPVIGLYNVVGTLQKSDDNNAGGFFGTDSLLSFGIGRFGAAQGSGQDLDGRSGDLALVDGSGGGDFYLGVAPGGAGFGSGFNVVTTGASNGSNGPVTVSFSHNLSAAGNCALPDAVAPTIVGANAVGLLPHGGVTTVTVSAGQENVTWLTFENDVEISDSGDLSKFLDIDVLGSSIVADTELGVYDSTGVLVTLDDDSGPGAFSQISFQGAGGPARPAAGDGLPYNGQDGPLAVGTYYLAVGLFDVVFQATRWGARSDSGSNLTVAVNFRTSSDCVADFNADGVVNPDDLADYIGAFFSVPPNPAADFNGDGGVDPDDLADFIGAFFSSPASCGG